jgi:hypothetical protein
MGTSNIFYPAMIIFKGIIEEVFERTFSQLPLKNVHYPFAVYEITLLDFCPGNKLQILVDCWDNKLKSNRIFMLGDQLCDLLDWKSYDEAGIHMSGNIERSGIIPTLEENLTRFQLVGIYDIYKK